MFGFDARPIAARALRDWPAGVVGWHRSTSQIHRSTLAIGAVIYGETMDAGRMVLSRAIRSDQGRVRTELYWFLGEQILEKQQTAKWGDGFLAEMSKDLLAEFPLIAGFLYRNLRRMRQWREFWQLEDSIWPQLVANTTGHGEKLVSKKNSTSAVQLVSQIP